MKKEKNDSVMYALVVIPLIAASANCQLIQKTLAKFSAPDINPSICANSTADETLNVRSQGQCIYECQHGGKRSTCVGVNYRPVDEVCEVFNKCPEAYEFNKADCQYLQVTKIIV
jgi:hypothetical protein